MIEIDIPALETQVAGDHYTKLSLQPLEATYLRYGYRGVKAAIHTKVDKYMSREKEDHSEDLQKARHCLDLLIEFYQRSKMDAESKSQS